MYIVTIKLNYSEFQICVEYNCANTMKRYRGQVKYLDFHLNPHKFANNQETIQHGERYRERE